jgi:hypothetical protein
MGREEDAEEMVEAENAKFPAEYVLKRSPGMYLHRSRLEDNVVNESWCIIVSYIDLATDVIEW